MSLYGRNGKMPDGMAIFSFRGGWSLSWGVTYCDTFSRRKRGIVSYQPRLHCWSGREKQTVEVSTTLWQVYGWNPDPPQTTSLFTAIEARMSVSKCEPCESEWLFLRISLTILRSNAYSILSAGAMKNGSLPFCCTFFKNYFFLYRNDLKLWIEIEC